MAATAAVDRKVKAVTAAAADRRVKAVTAAAVDRRVKAVTAAEDHRVKAALAAVEGRKVKAVLAAAEDREVSAEAAADPAASAAIAVPLSLRKPSQPRTINANNGIKFNKQTQSAKKIKKTITVKKTVKAWTAAAEEADPQSA
jgi:hypothetical protein